MDGIKVADMWCVCHSQCDKELRTTNGDVYYDMEYIPDELLFSSVNCIGIDKGVLIIVCDGLNK